MHFLKINLQSLFLTFVAVSCVVNYGFVESFSKFFRGRRFNVNRKLPLAQLLHYPPDQYYDQRLDHFNEAQTKTWKQRYWVNEEFFNGNGPVFIMIGGEGEENPIWMKNGQWIEFAKKFNALCVMLEHRFYGKSRPTEDLSTENLVYLSSEQGLADLATFRQFIHSKYNLTDSNRWVSFGGSYPGSLSAWFRLKYPHLVHAAISSSAPMKAVIDFTDYLVVVNQSLSLYSPDCPVQIAMATNQLQNYMSIDPEGREILEKMFNTCDKIITDDDVTNFYSATSGNFEGAVQYNRDNRAFEGAIDTNINISLLCDIMTNEKIGDTLSRYAKVNEVILSTYNQSCLDASYDSTINQLKQTSWNESAAVGGRQWTYQTCIEFGFFQSTDSYQQPFGQTTPVDFYVKQCRDIFGPSFNLTLLKDSVKNTNINYGGYNYQGSRVVFVNGQIDPWHALGFYQQPPNEFTQTVFIEGTAHCADMYPASENDLPSLTEARIKIGEYLSAWLTD